MILGAVQPCKEAALDWIYQKLLSQTEYSKSAFDFDRLYKD
jgi:hypothetical protein